MKGSLNGSLGLEIKRNPKRSGRVHESNLSRSQLIEKSDRLATYKRFRSLVARDVDLDSTGDNE